MKEYGPDGYTNPSSTEKMDLLPNPLFISPLTQVEEKSLSEKPNEDPTSPIDSSI